MGAYLSSPNRDKESVDFNGESLSYGACSMQGWRVSQEDAHNCCPDFDSESKSSLFAVYDGHGGAEVAQYTSNKFPDFLKKNQQYKEGSIAQSLEDAFMAFDEHLTKEYVIDELKELAGVEAEPEDAEEHENEIAGLYEDAEMPIDKLMERYGATNKSFEKLREKGDDFQSPALRPKKDPVDKVEAAHIKENMSNKLMNGSLGNGDSEAAVAVNDKENGVHSNSIEEIANKAAPVVSDSSSKVGSSEISDKKESIDKSTTSQGNDKTLPDSTQTDFKVSRKLSSASASSAEAATNVTDVSTSCQDSAADKAAAVGASGDASGSSSAGGSGGSGSNPSHLGQASSSSTRTRSGRTGVIPAEGEDETSEEEETSESDDLDEDDITESDSEDDDMAGFEGMDDDDDDDAYDADERGPLFAGGEEPGSDSGCTAVVAVLRQKELFVGNAGDSRCVVCRDGKAIDMSIDHKPEDELELKRIEKAGGQVTEDNRVNGGLNLSRAIGDHVYKKNKELPLKEQMITALPDVKSLTLTDKDEFMILACDGIWNVMTSQDACIFVRDRFKAGVTKISSIIEEMFDFCLAPDTTGDGTGCDNMTCIIVKFDRNLTDASAKRPATEQEDSKPVKKAKDGD